MNLMLPFVGRGKEVQRLRQLYAQRKTVLILGPAGVGKTALVQYVAGLMPLWVCPHSERLTDICDALESQFGIAKSAERLVPRKQRLRQAIAAMNRPVVFDSVGRTTPTVSSFLGGIMERVPVWLVCRSASASKVGHIWEFLSAVERVELQPFHRAETRALIAAAVQADIVPADTMDAVENLHHLAHGLPQMLTELLTAVAKGHYDLHRRGGLKLLDLDRRIQRLAPTLRLSDVKYAT